MYAYRVVYIPVFRRIENKKRKKRGPERVKKYILPIVDTKYSQLIWCICFPVDTPGVGLGNVQLTAGREGDCRRGGERGVGGEVVVETRPDKWKLKLKHFFT